jgi:ferrochelatase
VNLGGQSSGDSVGVVLFQLGGPDSLEAVEPFLYNLFSDPDIIDFPFAKLARPTLAHLIYSRRAKKVRSHYAEIGGKSPIRELTDLQAKALERELGKTLAARVFVAMRYWHPLTEEAARQVAAHDFSELVLLPLYPQYSRTTTGSSLNEWHRRYQPAPTGRPRVKIIRDFYSDTAYLDAVVERINKGLLRFAKSSSASTKDVWLLFSAHGVPMSVIQAGDPYQAQVEQTVKLVTERGTWPNPHQLCYQSRVGPGPWLRPWLDEALCGLARQGTMQVLVIPISFVSDHVETLNEIDIEARAFAQNLGIRQFEVMPALNDSPEFIQALGSLVLDQVGAKAVV